MSTTTHTARQLVLCAGIALSLGAAAGWDTHRRLVARPELNALDFTYPWRAAGYLAERRDPYREMVHAPYTRGGPFLYPLPAAILTLPVAKLPVARAGAAFMGVSVALLSFALALGGLWRLTMLLSAPFFFAIWNVQWSPLLIASALVPGIGWLGIAKPNLGLVAFLHTPRWSTIIGGLALLAFSLALLPGWPGEWLAQIANEPSPRPPALLWSFGAVGLVGLLRWRTAEGRTLAAITLVPTSAWFYDQLFVWLVPRTWKESLVLTTSSWLAYLATLAQAPIDLTAPGGALGVQATLALGIYLPAAVIVWRRANRGTLSARLETLASHLPRWLRGVAEVEAPASK